MRKDREHDLYYRFQIQHIGVSITDAITIRRLPIRQLANRIRESISVKAIAQVACICLSLRPTVCV